MIQASSPLSASRSGVDLADPAASGRIGLPQPVRRILRREHLDLGAVLRLHRRPVLVRLVEQHAGVEREHARARPRLEEQVQQDRLLLLERAGERHAGVEALHRVRDHRLGGHPASTSSGVSCSVHHSGWVRPGEVAERLALAVVRLVEREDPQQRLVELPVRDLLEHDVAEARVGPEPAADADVHRLDELAVDLLEHALDADVGDLVLGAARRAAREVQAEVLAVAVPGHVRVEELGDLGRAVLGVDLGQPAELLAGAGLQPAREQLGLGRELLGERLGQQRVDALVGDPRQQHVLLVGEPDLGDGRVLAGEPHELVQLVAAQAPDRHAEADRGVLAVGLRGHADVVVAAQVGGDAGGAPDVVPEPLDELLAQAVGPDLVDQELQPRLAALGAVLVGVAEDRGDPGDDLGRLLRRDEDVDRAREARRAGEPAADADVEAGGAVLVDRARQRDVVDEAARAVLLAARDGDLVLAREVRVELVVEEVLVDRLRDRVAVGDLLVADAGQRAADDVAGDVAAGAGGREPDLLQPREDLGDLVERQPVVLEALARRAIDDPAGEVVGDLGHHLGLVGGQHALHDLRAQHEVAVLRVVRIQPVPLEPHEVVVVQRFPAHLGRPHERGEDVEAVLLCFARSNLFMDRPK